MDKRLKKILYSFGIFILLFAIGIIFLITKNSDSIECHELKVMKDQEIQAIIERKYKDFANHSFETLELKSGSDVKKFYFMFEQSGFYHFTQVGDSVFKDSNSLTIILKRDELRKSFKLDYGCITEK